MNPTVSRIWTSLFFMFGLHAQAFAETPIPGYPESGHWPYGPSYTAETWSDESNSLLFYGEGTVMKIADISDPANMSVLGEVRTGSLVWHIDILENGQLAAVSDRNKWVSLIDISTPSAPTLLGRFEVDAGRVPYGLAFGPAIDGVLYVAIGPAGMYALNIFNPASPTLAGSYIAPGTDFVFDVEILGDYAFLADDVEGVTAIDVSNPVLPVFSAVFPAAAGASHISIDGSTAYVSRRNGGVHIIDLDVSGTPAVMTEAGVIETSEAPQGFGIFYRAEIAENGRAVIADGINGNGLLVFDIDNPASPVYEDYFPQSMFYVAVLGNKAFASRPDGVGVPQVRAIDVDLVGNASAPEQIDELWTFENSAGINIDGDLILVGNNSAGAVIIDASDPSNPVTRARIDLGNSSAKSVAKVGNTLVVATYSNKLQIVDVSDLDNPTLLTPYNLAGGATGYQVTRIPGTDRVLLAANTGGVKIIDFSNPNSPSLYSEWIPSSGNVTRAAIDGSIVAAGGNKDFWVIDFTLPATPVELDSETLTPNFLDIDIQGDLVYVATDLAGLRIWDYVTGGALSEVGSFSTNPTFANGIEVIGSTAYIAADTFYGMLIVDVSNPASPSLIQWVVTPGSGFRVDANDSMVVLSDLNAGVRVWGQTPPPVGPVFEDGFEAD